MIKFEHTEVVGWEPTIRGMRNPKNSWDRSDSKHCPILSKVNDKNYKWRCAGCKNEFQSNDCTVIGPDDHELMMSLAKGGPVHAKYRRMTVVYVDITAPLYWWKEFDTYKIGTVANSCSTMHKIHAKEFTMEDFSCEHLLGDLESLVDESKSLTDFDVLCVVMEALNTARRLYLETGDKKHWWQMIQLLPSSFNQKRTIMMNYEVLAGIYPMRKDHKLDEWHDFCHWIEELPYSEIIIGDAK